MTDLLPLSVLKGMLGMESRVVAANVCHRCGTSVPDDHPHFANIEARTLDCVCVACHAAVAAGPQGGNSPRAIPRRYVRLPEEAIADENWNAFDIPVGIAFFFHNSTLGRTVVSYPSPAGATESLLPPEAWERVFASNSLMRGIAPDVEAVLVRRTHVARDYFIVPIDACYELAGRIRHRWTGFGGGPEVQEQIESFFSMLHQKSEMPGS